MNANQPSKRRSDREKYQWTHLPLLLRSNMVQRVFGVSARDIQRWAKEGRLTPVYTGVKQKQPKYRTLQVAALLGLDTGSPAFPVFVGEDLRETISLCATESLERFRKELQQDLRQQLAALAAQSCKWEPGRAQTRPSTRRQDVETVTDGSYGTY